MADYARLIDAETWAFIARTNAHYPPDTVDYTVEQQRAIYDRMCGEFFAGYPEGVTAETTAIDMPTHRIPVRVYRSEAQAAATILYFHGGGFILGGLESHDDVCADLCGRTGCEVVSVDYRLAPEHIHPAQADDALSAFEWLARTRRDPIILAGDSAGGNLAAGLAQRTRGHVRAPIGQVLIYPGLGGDQTHGSYVMHAEAPMLTTRDLRFYEAIRSGGSDFGCDPTFRPLAEADLARMPPTVVITAECDPLSSDGGTYRDRILNAGGQALLIEEPGLVHGYLRARHTVGRARDSFSRIIAAVSALRDGGLPRQ